MAGREPRRPGPRALGRYRSRRSMDRRRQSTGSAIAGPCKSKRDSFAILRFSIFTVFNVSTVFTCLLERRYLHPGKLLVDGVTSFSCGLRLFQEVFEAGRIGALNHSEARFVAHVIGDLRFWRSIVELERRFTLRDAVGIEAV